jgi:hypothetical protein
MSTKEEPSYKGDYNTDFNLDVEKEFGKYIQNIW